MTSTKCWRKSLGETGLRVYLFERTPGGTLYREVYVGGQRVASKKSLRHRDKDRAEAEAYTLLAKLKAREEALDEGKLTLSALFECMLCRPRMGPRNPRHGVRTNRCSNACWSSWAKTVRSDPFQTQTLSGSSRLACGASGVPADSG